MKFAIFTHVIHTSLNGRYYAYAPYIREMNLWLGHVDSVEVVAPLKKKSLSSTALSYEHSEFEFTEIPSFDHLSGKNFLQSLLSIPFISYRIFKAMGRADHLHLRCPGNIGLLACVIQILFPNKTKSAKYAGNWDPGAKQPWSYKLQKWILNNSFLTRKMKVLVYGEWKGQSKNIYPFFTASFSEKEKEEVKEKDFKQFPNFIFVGNLVEGKQPLEAIKFVKSLKDKLEVLPGNVFKLRLDIYGEGPLRKELEEYCSINNLEGLVCLKGNHSLENLKKAYQKAHFLILPSRSEGWPKAVAEAMFYGCIPVSTPVSCVPWMLGYGKRGLLLKEYYESFSSTNALKKNEVQNPITRNPERSSVIKMKLLFEDRQKMKGMSKAAKEWSQQYTLERFETAVVKLLNSESDSKN